MFKRKLSALEYPEFDSVTADDEKGFRKLIVWLEENKIKKYKPESRQNLRNINSSEWQKTFDRYKQDVGCPITSSKCTNELDWFIKYALKLEYRNKKSTYEKHTVDNMKSANTPNVVADNPLDHLEFDSADFDTGMKSIARMLKLPPHPNPTIMLKAASKMITSRLSLEVLAKPEDYIATGTPFPYDDGTDPGFNLGDVALNKAAKILRLLYIQDLRFLQTKANELVVAVQNHTANPKTDTKLGKVGK